MVDRYYRKIEDVENNIENAMQISGILLKLKGYDDDLSKIDTNENNISSNLGKINNNSSIISTNFKQITTNAGNISSNKGLIETNTSNKGLIETNTSNISSNKGLIETNTSNISSNLKKISTNTKSISTNLEKIDNFTQYILQSGKDFEEKYTIEKQIFKFDKNKHFYTLFEKEIEFEFTKNSLLFVKNNMYYKYENLSDDYHRLQHEYNIYDGDNLIHKYLFNKDTYYDKDPILHTNEDFCICFKKNYNKIKINLQLHRHNRHGVGNINLEIDDDNESYINIDYLDRNNDGNNEQVDINVRDISSNLGKINTNVTDISSNLGKINNIVNNLILKNVYYITLFYDKKKVIVNKPFFSKTFDNINIKKNDFIEMDFNMFLEYGTIKDSELIYTVIEFLDDDDKKIFSKSIGNSFFRIYYTDFKFISINKNIFYTFEKDITSLKMKVELYRDSFFQSWIDKIWYLPKYTDQSVLKHYKKLI